ncbi:hypothetical protein M8W55_004538 [Salmonella enterica]|nr:hypothetical protein [Salmonella enterica subsp. enterica serovar Bareilly]EHJ7503922.1 hypothetical protein [Salmonella enterica]ESH77164.1 hypothetical protein SEEB0183_02236 [Salmonella enterica subsp. enterica serovar Bareilly str. CFSAN000183]KFU21965.1 transposase [Salmonella enterica subsp. enterica serovar Bareilly str. CFSAN000194]QUZ82342.1 hypothetical protein AWA28_00445 [Salmonella enterica subsp. enterica serovar Bareilly str. CFSAN000224]HCZ4946432.1 hypothetical protein [Sal
MHKAHLPEHQNIAVIKLVEAGRTVKDICQEADICEVTDYIYGHWVSPHPVSH